MLKKSERLDRASFTNYFKKGKKINGAYTTIVFHPNPVFLASVVVGKKVSKKAVTRNSIRRRLYGIIESERQDKKVTGAYIIIAKPEISKLTKKAFNTTLLAEVGRVLK
ncbi:MAG TPA: ribonuclease P protein component [Candidatus Paceibacterota bacterium]|nr:ribonuclease P protein component [Candidatus Paceibacterota bacterium]HMO82613.1 ribonuclease P protein component [Candidatus Paceibacterota bacterium]